MSKLSKKEIVSQLLNQKFDSEDEKEIIEMLIKKPITIDIEKREEENITFGDKVADKVATIAGSWPFIIIFSLFLLGWIILNGIIIANKAIDPYPFILLNLVLSCIAALQAPIIMMSQNRQAKKDSLRNQFDYQIDLKSELILEDIHEDLKKLMRNQEEILKYINENKKVGK